MQTFSRGSCKVPGSVPAAAAEETAILVQMHHEPHLAHYHDLQRPRHDLTMFLKGTCISCRHGPEMPHDLLQQQHRLSLLNATVTGDYVRAGGNI